MYRANRDDKGDGEMTYAEFIQECSKRTIHKSVAIENEKIKQALRDRNDELVKKLMVVTNNIGVDHGNRECENDYDY